MEGHCKKRPESMEDEKDIHIHKNKTRGELG